MSALFPYQQLISTNLYLGAIASYSVNSLSKLFYLAMTEIHTGMAKIEDYILLYVITLPV